MLSDKIRTLDLPRPLSVESGTSVRQVIKKVQHEAANCVLITAGGRLIGIITERDVLMKIVARDVDYEEPVDTFMTREPLTLTPDHTIGEAITLMNDEGFRHIPIIDPTTGEAISIFSVLEIINYLAEAHPEQVLNLPPRPHQLMTTPEGG